MESRHDDDGSVSTYVQGQAPSSLSLIRTTLFCHEIPGERLILQKYSYSSIISYVVVKSYTLKILSHMGNIS